MRNATLGLALLLTMSIPLSLTGCGGDTSKTVTGTVAGTKDGKPAKPPEEPLVTDAEVAKYVDAQPDSKYSFPEKEFTEARPYIFSQEKPAQGEKILKGKLEDAVRSQAGQTKLGQYCIRLGIALWDQGKQKEAMKYFILAQKIFYAQPQERRPMPNWFFNAHMYPGLYYNGIRNYPLAETEWKKCVNISVGAPTSLIQNDWRKVAMAQLVISLKAQGKNEQAKQVNEQMKKL